MKISKVSLFLLASFLSSILLSSGALATAANVSVVIISAPTSATYAGNYINPLTFNYEHYTNTTDSISLVALLNGTAIQTTNPYTNFTAVAFGYTVANGAWNLTVYAHDNVLNKNLAVNESDFVINEYTQTVSNNTSSVLTIGILGILTMGIFAYVLEGIGVSDGTVMKFLILGVLILVIILALLLLPLI